LIDNDRKKELSAKGVKVNEVKEDLDGNQVLLHRRKLQSTVLQLIRSTSQYEEISMNASTNPSPKGKSPSQQIDAIIREPGDWRGRKLSDLRALIKKADPAVIEEVKWKKPSKPSGVPVWSHDGTICIADTLKNAVRLTFPKGAQIKDPKKLFNTRLDSKTVRAIDFHEGETVDEAALKALILDAVRLNMSKERER
jgi:hypothetical protein